MENAPRGSAETKIVSQLPRAIEVLFRARAIRAARALLRSLQTLRKVIQTTLDRAFVRTAAALLTVLLTLLAALLTTLLAIKGLFAFPNPVRDTIARQRIRGIFQLSRGALLSLALSGAHRTRRLLDVLLQTTHRISQRVFAFR